MSVPDIRIEATHHSMPGGSSAQLRHGPPHQEPPIRAFRPDTTLSSTVGIPADYE